MILEGYNKGGNITKLAENILSQWREDLERTRTGNLGESRIELWLRTLSGSDPLTRNVVIDLATVNGNEDKIYENLIEAGRQIYTNS